MNRLRSLNSADPDDCARADVAPFVGLSPQQRFAGFLDVLDLSEAMLVRMSEDRRRRAWSALDELDDPGRWWERVPAR